MFTRVQKLVTVNSGDSIFLWGARQTGKTTLLKHMFPNAVFYDLLHPATYSRLLRSPQIFLEELSAEEDGALVVIDEIQRIPQLLDAVQWLIVNKHHCFVMSGSSARKLKRIGANLLGGRAVRKVLYPLVSAEIPDFDLDRAINNGMIPRHYMVADASERLGGYVGDYLREEIAAEALLRNLSSFHRFMEAAAFTDGEMVNYVNIAQDCGVSAKTVKSYFEILEDTLVGCLVPSFRGVKKRRVLSAPKFYYFDVGVVNYLQNRGKLHPGSADYGHAFEHFLMQEIIAYLGYLGRSDELSYWHTYKTDFEVDAILGDAKVAIEFKATKEVATRHLRSMKAFADEFPDAKRYIVSLDERPRLVNGVTVLPIKVFLKRLWDGAIYC